MKNTLWNILVLLVGCIPRLWRAQFCRLSFAASAKGSPDESCKELLLLQDNLFWYIDQSAIRYEGGLHPKHRLTNYHLYFSERIKKGDKVLDVGCGIGAVAYNMAKHGAKVIGIDYDRAKIAHAQLKYNCPGLSFVEGDVTEALPDENFDVIVLSNVLEHIDDRKKLLKILVSRFSPQRILLRVPMINRDWTVPFKKELGLEFFCDPDHRIEYTAASFTAEMAAAGLEIRELQINWGEIWAETTVISS
ncbi:MAG: class I SAM-dependent methyltransferase [Candidatus Electrothrix sp. AUS1_2]|nr:class I SAM-dependent methyltransferase [Candidatus Electrothrix sp. AUS1_2]